MQGLVEMDESTCLLDWDFPVFGINEHDENNELRQRLLKTTQEVEKLKAEISEKNDYVNKLIRMLKYALQQRDEANNQLQELINTISSPPSISTDPFDPIMDSLIQGRVLPQNGMFQQEVLQAGPLLQTLLAAPPPPKWLNPPQLQAFPVPINGGDGSVGQFVGRENSSLPYANFGYGTNSFY